MSWMTEMRGLIAPQVLQFVKAMLPRLQRMAARRQRLLGAPEAPGPEGSDIVLAEEPQAVVSPVAGGQAWLRQVLGQRAARAARLAPGGWSPGFRAP
ncbi:MAG TPA: hypothetical protein VD902_01135, partial [Symbiobacteriaceae bacterium]|nr:hypothetical protein [Symbiobacteriaceae bacterium]